MLTAPQASIVFLILTASLMPAAQEKPESLSRYYGFTDIEIFKLERRSGNMLKGDFNADGLLDLLLVDNSHSRIDLLQQRKEGEADKPSRANDITNDWRFKHIKIPVDRSIATMASGDFNNDGNSDIAYLGTPDRIVVRFQSKDKKSDWNERFSVRLPNVTPAMWMMASGDLNNDRRDDLVVLGKDSTYLLYQTEDGKLDTPVSIMNTSASLSLVQIADLDGDGLDDLSYLAASGTERGLCARMQLPSGELGPELRFDLNRPRSVTLFNVDETPATEILTIDQRTGRVVISRVQQPKSKDGELAARLTQYGFGEEGKNRDLAIGDIDGDNLEDVVVTDPDKAQMIVFRQEKTRGLSRGETFPGLLGANHTRVVDLDGDGKSEVVVMSPKEKVIAVSNFADGRLTFPKTLPTGAGIEPICFDVTDLDGDGKSEVVYVGRRKDGRKSKTVLMTLSHEGDEWKPADEQEFDFSGEPIELKSLDANNDGRPDLMVFFDLNKPPAVLLNGKDKIEILSTEGGFQLGKLGPGNVTVSKDANSTALLVSQESFARRLDLKDSKWQVVDQYNAAEAKAKVSGSLELNLDGKPGNEIVLIDTGVKKLRVLRKSDNVFRPWREVELGAISYEAAHVRDLNGDKKDDLLIVGKGQFAVLYAEQTDPTLKEVASFESKLDRVYFQDLIAGDLNADGRPDLAIIDTRSHYVELLNFNPEKGLRHAMQFKVFEEKSFSADRARSGVEPREGMIADVTGDGRSDLLLLSHDRVLLYPQDSGKPSAAEASDDNAANQR